MFAKPRRVVAIAGENVANRASAPGHDRVVTRITGRKFRNIAEADAVVIAAREKRGPRRRTQCRGMKLVVTQPMLVDAIEVRGLDRAAEGAGRSKAGVVSHDQQHIRRALRGCYCAREIRLRFTRLAPNHAAKLWLGFREDCRASRRRALRERGRRQSDNAAKRRRHRDGFKQVPLVTHAPLPFVQMLLIFTCCLSPTNHYRDCPGSKFCRIFSTIWSMVKLAGRGLGRSRAWRTMAAPGTPTL